MFSEAFWALLAYVGGGVLAIGAIGVSYAVVMEWWDEFHGR